MARHPRYRIAGLPQHVIQRGNNRVATFHSAGDFHFYLECLGDAAQKCGCAIHAYVLMTNHVHLLATPEGGDNLSDMMQSIGRRFVRFFNDRYTRTGTLWEGRFKAVPVDTEGYLAACHRYIESNPVRAGLVGRAGDYWWSSFRRNAFGEIDPIVTPHPWYVGNGATDDARQRAYRRLFERALEPATLDQIRHAINSAWVSGSDAFIERIRDVAARPCHPKCRGGARPGAGRPPENPVTGRENGSNPTPSIRRNQSNLTPLISGWRQPSGHDMVETRPCTSPVSTRPG